MKKVILFTAALQLALFNSILYAAPFGVISKASITPVDSLIHMGKALRHFLDRPQSRRGQEIVTISDNSGDSRLLEPAIRALSIHRAIAVSA